MKERARQGIGVDVNQANLITQEQELFVGKHGFLGSENAALLRDTLVWVLGVQFALRAGQEHRNLTLRNSQLSLQCDELGREFLQYTEDISKTNNGGLSHLRIKRKVVRVYKNLTNVERCPVELYKNTCLTCQMKSATTHFICALCQSQMGKYGTTKRQQGKKL